MILRARPVGLPTQARTTIGESPTALAVTLPLPQGSSHAYDARQPAEVLRWPDATGNAQGGSFDSAWGAGASGFAASGRSGGSEVQAGKGQKCHRAVPAGWRGDAGYVGHEAGRSRGGPGGIQTGGD